jgi:hypothetical protein
MSKNHPILASRSLQTEQFVLSAISKPFRLFDLSRINAKFSQAVMVPLLSKIYFSPPDGGIGQSRRL